MVWCSPSIVRFSIRINCIYGLIVLSVRHCCNRAIANLITQRIVGNTLVCCPSIPINIHKIPISTFYVLPRGEEGSDAFVKDIYEENCMFTCMFICIGFIAPITRQDGQGYLFLRLSEDFMVVERLNVVRRVSEWPTNIVRCVKSWIGAWDIFLSEP